MHHDHEEFMRGLVEVIRRVAREVYAEERAAPSPDELLTVAEAAAVASVRPATVRAWVKAGHLPRFTAGRQLRVRRGDLEAAMRGDRRVDRRGSPEELGRRAAERVLMVLP